MPEEPFGTNEALPFLKNPRALIVVIQGLLPSLTPAERAIATVLLELRNADPELLRAAHIAERAQVSEAAIVKFCKRLGLTGFRELRGILLQYQQTPSIDLHEELSLNDDSETIVRKVFHTAVQSINDTMAVFDYHAFERAAEAIAHATTRLFFGVGGSATIARDFEHKLLRIGIIGRAHDDTHLMAMGAALLEPGDVALGISHSGSTLAVIEALQIARARGATTIGITNMRESPLTALAHISLVSASQGSPITGENAASRIAQLNILDALFVRIAQYNRDQAIRHLEATMKSVSQKRLT